MKRTNEYVRRHLFWLVLAALMIVPARLGDAARLGTATVRCDVIDVVEMLKDGLDRTQIRGECGGKVDAGTCTLTKVVRLAKRGLSESDIEDVCSDDEPRILNAPRNAPPRPRFATICDTPYASCPIVVGAGPPGAPCWCATPFGTVYGVSR